MSVGQKKKTNKNTIKVFTKCDIYIIDGTQTHFRCYIIILIIYLCIRKIIKIIGSH